MTEELKFSARLRKRIGHVRTEKLGWISKSEEHSMQVARRDDLSVIENFGLDAWFGDDEAGEEGAAVQGFGSGSANQLGVVIVLADVAQH